MFAPRDPFPIGLKKAGPPPDPEILHLLGRQAEEETGESLGEQSLVGEGGHLRTPSGVSQHRVSHRKTPTLRRRSPSWACRSGASQARTRAAPAPREEASRQV